MAYSKMAAYTWFSTLDQEYQWSYSDQETMNNNAVMITIPSIKIKQDFDDYLIVILCRESDSAIYGIMPTKVPPAKRTTMAELITKVNYEYMWFGRYDMDYGDGEVRYCFALDYEGSILSKEMCKNAINFTVSAGRNIQNAMNAVINSGKSAEQAFTMYEH